VYLTGCPLTQGERFAKAEGSAGRVQSLDAIEAWIALLLDKIPVTRVSDISRLDMSPAAVFAAITPMARDLTTHMGKGPSAQAAWVSAVMEAVERVSGETLPGSVLCASQSELTETGIACVDPLQFDLPPCSAFTPHDRFDWAEGWDLIARQPVRIPADLCKSPPDQGILAQVDTNGLASGATYGEAIRHALLEVIERDAVSQHQFFDLFGTEGHEPPPARRIDASTLPAACTDYIAATCSATVDVSLSDITTDLGIPVVACTLIDTAYPTASGPARMLFGGWGAETGIAGAVNRAVSEAHQARIGMIQGARDSFNLDPNATRPFTRRRRAAGLRAEPERGVAASVDFPGPDIASETEEIIDRLRRVGIRQVVVVDMTNPLFAIPVVRVRVPGLALFAADRRRIGWRCARHVL
jgi:ribosomal protein S12 methylthiotransferase accessory factor